MEAENSEDYSNFEESSEGEGGDQSMESSLTEEIETQTVNLKNYEVLSKEDILRISDLLISEIKAVCNLPSSGASALLRKYEFDFLLFFGF